MIVAAHQPNYFPWLGYFAKIAQADLFVFLDDVQFSKNGYCNRVQVLHQGRSRWLTVPVSFTFGDSIDTVQLAQPDWARRHLDALRGFYKEALCFTAVWRDLEELYSTAPATGLAKVNRHLVESIAHKLGLSCRYTASSDIEVGDTRGDERLVQIVSIVAPEGTYLSGTGGARYQEEAKFSAAGLALNYAGFEHPQYHQGGTEVVTGLSVIDAVFHLGWEQTGRLASGHLA